MTNMGITKVKLILSRAKESGINFQQLSSQSAKKLIF